MISFVLASFGLICAIAIGYDWSTEISNDALGISSAVYVSAAHIVYKLEQMEAKK